MVYENTLLIVESPTVQKIISDFEIPYLTPVATHGFCWRPIYDDESQQLSLKAVPGKRKIRNEIRDQARWASQVIIATDADASGEIIAHGVEQHLRRFDLNLKRTYLNGLSGSEIQRSLQRALPYSATNPKQRLKNRYQWSYLLQEKAPWKNIPFRYLHALLALTAVMYAPRPRRHFIDREGYRYISPSSPEKSAEEQFRVHNQGTADNDHRTKFPLNTADVLELMVSEMKYEYCSSAQEDLNSLFTQVPENLKTGLISYPRTKEHGFYPSTWNKFEKQWVRNRSWETLLPRPMRRLLTEESPHEAIYPLNLSYNPKSVRPFVAKKYYDLYKKIYNHHMQVLHRPSRRKTPLFKESGKSDAKYLLIGDGRTSVSGESAILTPCITLSTLSDELMNYKSIRPSRLGEFLDYLHNNRYIDLSGDSVVQPGPELKKFRSHIQKMNILIRLLDSVCEQLDGKLDLDMISDLLTSIFEHE